MTTEREYREWFTKRNKNSRYRGNNNPKFPYAWVLLFALAGFFSIYSYLQKNPLSITNKQVQNEPRQDSINQPKSSVEDQKEPSNAESSQKPFYVNSMAVEMLASSEAGEFYHGSEKKVAQGKFLFLTVRATNTSQASSVLYSHTIHLKDNKGRIYPVDIMSSAQYQSTHPDQSEPISIAILPGMSKTFILVFDVNLDSENFNILVSQP
jgi:hypothetical protein